MIERVDLVRGVASQPGEHVALLIVDMMFEAGLDHLERGAETWLVGELVHAQQSGAGEVVFVATFGGRFVTDHLGDDRIQELLLDGHVLAKLGGEFGHERDTLLAGVGRGQLGHQPFGFSVLGDELIEDVHSGLRCC